MFFAKHEKSLLKKLDVVRHVLFAKKMDYNLYPPDTFSYGHGLRSMEDAIMFSPFAPPAMRQDEKVRIMGENNGTEPFTLLYVEFIILADMPSFSDRYNFDASPT